MFFEDIARSQSDPKLVFECHKASFEVGEAASSFRLAFCLNGQLRRRAVSYVYLAELPDPAGTRASQQATHPALLVQELWRHRQYAGIVYSG